MGKGMSVAAAEQITIAGTGRSLREKTAAAISRIQWAYEVSTGYGMGALWVAFSGGKDSVALLELVKTSGVPYEAHYNITGIDPPELYYFIRDECPDVKAGNAVLLR